jgi:hypothetical protein
MLMDYVPIYMDYIKSGQTTAHSRVMKAGTIRKEQYALLAG